jgi:hypothetical protein
MITGKTSSLNMSLVLMITRGGGTVVEVEPILMFVASVMITGQ